MNVFETDAEALPYGHDSFDCALIVTTICFVADPAQSCREAWRVLRLGGCLAVGFVDRDSFLGKHYEARREQSPFYHDARFFSAREMERLLVETGFRDLQFKQTLFHHPDEIHEAEQVMCGHGQGRFAVVVGVKKDGNHRSGRVRPRKRL